MELERESRLFQVLLQHPWAFVGQGDELDLDFLLMVKIHLPPLLVVIHDVKRVEVDSVLPRLLGDLITEVPHLEAVWLAFVVNLLLISFRAISLGMPSHDHLLMRIRAFIDSRSPRQEL